MDPLTFALDGACRILEAWPLSPALIRLLASTLSHPIDGVLGTERVCSLQWLRLRRAVNYAYAHSTFYRERLDALHLQPRTLRTWDDFRRLPFTTADDLHEWPSFIAVPEDRLAHVFTTAGTTGEPKRVYFTTRELRALHNIAALGLRLQMLGRLVVLVMLPSGLWIGTVEAQCVVECAGGLALNVGTPDPAQAIAQLCRFAPNVVISSPAYMVALTRTAERQNFRAQLDAIVLGGEMLTREHVEYLQHFWHAAVYNTYGMTEIGGGQALSLPSCPCLHLNGLQLFTEIIDPRTGQPAEEGELVFTPLVREAMPLLRYRSGDLGRWCHCRDWLPFGSIVLSGRADDMLVVADMNLFAHVLADSVAHVAGATGRIAIFIDRSDLTDRLRLRVEGQGVRESDVRTQLLGAYPELGEHLANGELQLTIESDAVLNGQLKAVSIADQRMSGYDNRPAAETLRSPN